MTTNVSAPPRPSKPVKPDMPDAATSPQPDYSSWLPSDFLSRGWCTGAYWMVDGKADFYLKGKRVRQADQFCLLGALMAWQGDMSLARLEEQPVTVELARLISGKPHPHDPLWIIEDWNDLHATAETALEVLREAERKVGLR